MESINMYILVTLLYTRISHQNISLALNTDTNLHNTVTFSYHIVRKSFVFPLHCIALQEEGIFSLHWLFTCFRLVYTKTILRLFWLVLF